MEIEATDNTIVLDKSIVERQGGVVILPLKKWQEIENGLEDLAMFNSDNLAQEIKESRQEKETIPMEEVLDKYNI